MKQKLCQLLLTAVTCGVQGFSPRCLSSSDLNFFLMPTLTLQNGVNIKPSPPCWPLRRWVHPAGLHSHHPAEAGRGGSDHRRPHGAGAVRTARNKQHSAPVGKPNFPAGALRFSPVPKGYELAVTGKAANCQPMWVTVWVYDLPPS